LVGGGIARDRRMIWYASSKKIPELRPQKVNLLKRCHFMANCLGAFSSLCDGAFQVDVLSDRKTEYQPTGCLASLSMVT